VSPAYSVLSYRLLDRITGETLRWRVNARATEQQASHQLPASPKAKTAGLKSRVREGEFGTEWPPITGGSPALPGYFPPIFAQSA
jgi:hypothetical protein